MGNFRRINKTVVKFLKHLLNSASSDRSRPMLQAIHVTEEYCCTANGFMLTFLQSKVDADAPALLDLHPGDYIAQLGTLNHVAIVEMVEYTTDNFPGAHTDYPNLLTVLHKKETQPIISFSVNPGLLRLLLKEADSTPVIFHIFSPTETIELQYKVDGRAAYSCIMPMHTPDAGKDLWKPE